MIEVEKKFHTSEKIYQFLHSECSLEKEVILDDVYIDTPEFDLITRNIWLRSRNGGWELKLPQGDFDPLLTSYQELETEEAIIAALHLPLDDLTFNDLKKLNYHPIAEFRSTRKSYNYKNFTIDLDTTSFGLELIEIEMLVNSEKDIASAKQEIINLAYTIDSEIKEATIGKLRYFLLQEYPEIDEQLVLNGIVPEVEL